MLPTARYTQARINIETGRLLEFTATPPARHHSAADPRHVAAELPRLPEAPEPSRQNLLYLDANRFQTHTGPKRARFRDTPAISTPTTDETAVSRGPLLLCR